MKKDLTKGPILPAILHLALPIAGASLLTFTYNFTDMLWVGRLGSDAVAAVGTSSFFIYLGWALASVIFVGTGIKVSQAMGKKDTAKAIELGQSAVVGLLIMAAVYFLLLQVFYKQLIAFFDLNNIAAETMAHDYLRWASVGMLFTLVVQLFTSLSNARGDSKTPFRFTLLGVLLNVALDPLFIFVFKLGVVGAAQATLLAQLISASLFVYTRGNDFLGKGFSRWNTEALKEIVRIGIPPSVQRILFAFVGIVMAKIVAQWGSDAIAAQKIGLQIESMSFMTLGGLSGAILSFTGQNFGGNYFGRVKSGYLNTLGLGIVIGLIMTAIFLIFPETMVRWFVQDQGTVEIGASYLRILGWSQVFMGIEMITSGVINGMGKTKIPAAINISMTLIRIPLALWLSGMDSLGIDGVWLAIVISTVLRCIFQVAAYLYLKDRLLKIQAG